MEFSPDLSPGLPASLGPRSFQEAPAAKMQATMLRGSPFTSARVARPATSRRTTVMVQAVQDVKGTVVSTHMQNTVVVSDGAEECRLQPGMRQRTASPAAQSEIRAQRAAELQ